MPIIAVDTDVLINIISTPVYERLLGFSSEYVEEPHPVTGKTIQGWKWDELPWPPIKVLSSYANAPTLLDPNVSGIDETYYQSGIGDDTDLLMVGINEILTSGVEIWAPHIHHGWFYIYEDEWYLFSDSFQTHSIPYQVVSGLRYMDLQYRPKPGIPIQVHSFYFDDDLKRYKKNIEFRQVVEFTVSGTSPEFTISGTVDAPRVWLNGEWDQEIGQEITLVSGELSTPEDLATLEELGVSNGEPSQEFATIFSPIEPTASVEIWSYLDPTAPIAWTTIDMTEDFDTYSGAYVVKLDRDMGIIKFGDSDGSEVGGRIPAAGSRIAIHYNVGIAIQYEPDQTTDFLDAFLANINPVESASSKGFVQVTTGASGPAKIVLTADLPYSVDPII